MAAAASKEKGNAAFKAGDYPAAIGHYTNAAIADPSDPTYFLNRAAAYLKLSKYEDAERDCTAVLNLSKRSVKAFFRRAQARVALQKLGEAHNDLQWALKIEPKNDAVKAELARVDELILSGKGKTRTAPADITAPPLASSTSSPATPPRRRRVPITIVDSDDAPANAEPTNDLLNPISSRLLSTSVDPKSTTAPTADATPTTPTPKPEPASFKEAKQVRDEKNVGRVGGGIFRVSGNDTVFKTRDVPVAAPKDPAHPTANLAASVSSAPPPARSSQPTPLPPPRTLFEFTRVWEGIPASDTAARWALLNTFPPSSLPAFFGASLEPALLASLIPVLAEAAPLAAACEFMCALTRVPRFQTVVRFLSASECGAARALWEAVVLGTGDAQDADVVEAARAWGFAEHLTSTQ
ncbi:hypothetical protein EI94DRAFT_1671024 [Lactarius quietus]|nr:hypothetical protein EI94DRAFT_1671024 [Lactarius quietus]